jgi:hypothetical protein
MAIKGDAWERIEEKLKEQHGGSTRLKDRMERREHLMRKMLETENGREFFWEFVACATALGMKTYTGNADTYYILGMRRNAEELIESAKRTSLSLYHKMEAEAMAREEARQKEEK